MAPASSSSSDSSSSRSTSPEPANTQKKAIKSATKTKDEVEDDSSDSSDSSDSDSSSDSGSESDSESGSSSEMDTSEDATEEQSPAKRVHIPGPNQPYKPPFGFKSAKKQTPPSSSTSSVLSNLRGKQVFHITAPSFLPLSKVKEITMSEVLKGEPILTYDGKNYGIPADSITDNDPEGKSLLVYDESTQTYSNKADHIQSFHVQEFAGLPQKAVQSTATAIEILRDAVKPPRPQPKGMKMRFRPVGSLPSEPETLGFSSESESEEPQSKVPAGEKEKERKRKHSHTEGDASQASAEPRKKSKKHTQENDHDAERSQKKSKKSHKDREEKKRKRSEKA
ncbi:uncharacterized protein N7473_007367 [Penicillium subrubescens]|uniref:DNA-directed RNA polymerase I subunit RPA34.5 n=1 Tax=Penicillium subrubescens TaxID=1316194 RepID=A0A1Q5UQB3_9EURO|nr:uncharacterized protein N7473_007367 [Penicillium subrubescens]KAJ5891139.1 hypothetical protein N7473_007367 [Penicillium subrubescens]OKP14662.1 hypothetical protein PENSUB_11420 [Penicillium subrubescens]